MYAFIFFFNDTATTEIYTTTDTLSLHDALPISPGSTRPRLRWSIGKSPGQFSIGRCSNAVSPATRSEEHTSELQSPVVISYAVFCLKKKKVADASIAPLRSEVAAPLEHVARDLHLP